MGNARAPAPEAADLLLVRVHAVRNPGPLAGPADRLEVLTLLIEAYEREHYPIADPDPIDFLRHVMEARELSRRDLEPFIGSRARVAEVLNRVRPLTLDMIRRLAVGLKIPVEVLVRDYKLKRAA